MVAKMFKSPSNRFYGDYLIYYIQKLYSTANLSIFLICFLASTKSLTDEKPFIADPSLKMDCFIYLFFS